MRRDDVIDDYFEWLCELTCGEQHNERDSYRKLLSHLHRIEFVYSIKRDSNRAEDGIGLRYRFAYNYISPAAAETYLDGSCTVLEMILALAIRCEENIMDDPAIGDRTRQWFWGMIVNLGLGSMSDDRYDEQTVNDAIHRLLNRTYASNGKGGLFTVKNCDRDMRNIEIWHQLCRYLDTIM